MPRSVHGLLPARGRNSGGTRRKAVPGKRRATAIATAVACAALLLTTVAPAVETICPFDDAGRLLRLNPEQRAELALWPDRYPGFQEARLLRATDGRELLQILWREGDGLAQERIELSPEESDSLRAVVREWLAAGRGERAGTGPRTLLLSAATLTGLGFYSWGIPRAAQAQGKAAVATGMLSVGASFALPYIATMRESVTPGMAQLASWGLTHGIGYGEVLHRAWAGPNGDSRDGIKAGVIGSLACGVGGYFWARQGRLDLGRAHLLDIGSDLGTLAGVEAAIAFDLPADNYERDHSYEYVSVLAGTAAGIGGAAMRGRRSHPTWGDAEVLRTTSILAQGVVLTAWDLGTENESTVAGAALAGSIAGAWLGDRLTLKPDFRATQAVLLDLSAIAGGALVLGGVYLSETDSNSYDHEVFTVGATLGAVAGYVLAYRAFVDEAMSASRDGAKRISLTPRIGYGVGEPAPEFGLACTARF